jgi:hypothetical protein
MKRACDDDDDDDDDDDAAASRTFRSRAYMIPKALM